VWSLTSAPSGGSIDAGSGLYQAGMTTGVTDEVMVTANSEVATTNVKVMAGGEGPGAATSMDLDGGGAGITDVLMMIRYIVGLETFNPTELEVADFDCDGNVGIDDVINALRATVGLPPLAP